MQLSRNTCPGLSHGSTLIDPSAIIHPSAILGVDGMSHKRLADGRISANQPHLNYLVIEKDVEIGPLTVVHGGSIGSTIIRQGSKIGTHVNIGHNAEIGAHCLIAPQTTIGGSTVIGDFCWIGMKVAIASHITICHFAVIGMGSVVVRDIEEPGVYAGNPCKWLKEYSFNKQPF